ncbi:hypothetical protein LCGC14_0919900 [marine sediment metagenome]|uniref:Uncharacterized protein n=1 Tax=marine sediment metagenome TaxID=412755 RepID=A0A0F9NR81_9ZZZZ
MLEVTQAHIDKALEVRNRGIISTSQCPIGQAISELHDTYGVRVDEYGIAINGVLVYHTTNRMQYFMGLFDVQRRAKPTYFRLLKVR